MQCDVRDDRIVLRVIIALSAGASAPNECGLTAVTPSLDDVAIPRLGEVIRADFKADSLDGRTSFPAQPNDAGARLDRGGPQDSTDRGQHKARNLDR